jgi:hypothetical protein
MLAPPRPTTRGPVFRRRTLARGSLVGVGLLALTASGMPVAVAGDEALDPAAPGPEADLDGVGESAPEVLNAEGTELDARPASSIQGFFGSGKTVGFQVDYDEDTAPSGLDLSGAVFTLTRGDANVTCTTSATGFCSVTSAENGGNVPPGTYDVTQTAHPVGLAAATGVGSVHLCSWFEGYIGACQYDTFETVVNDSVLRSPVVTSVEDAITGAPIEGAEYTLTGPGFSYAPTRDVAAAVTAPPTQEVRATSAADGGLTFTGWFLPGTAYVLAPVDSVDGYLPDVETTGIEIAPSTGVLSASLDPRLLTPIDSPAPVAPVVPGGDTSPVTPAPVPAPVAAPAGAGAPVVGRPGRGAAPAEPVAAEPSTPITPVTPTTPPATTTFNRSGAADPTAAPLAGGSATPQLATVSSNLPDKGLAIALGGLFLIAILVGFGLVRRHARRGA